MIYDQQCGSLLGSANRCQKLVYVFFILIMFLKHSETIRNELLVKFDIDIGPAEVSGTSCAHMSPLPDLDPVFKGFVPIKKKTLLHNYGAARIAKILGILYGSFIYLVFLVHSKYI